MATRASRRAVRMASHPAGDVARSWLSPTSRRVLPPPPLLPLLGEEEEDARQPRQRRLAGGGPWCGDRARGRAAADIVLVLMRDVCVRVR